MMARAALFFVLVIAIFDAAEPTIIPWPALELSAECGSPRISQKTMQWLSVICALVPPRLVSEMGFNEVVTNCSFGVNGILLLRWRRGSLDAPRYAASPFTPSPTFAYKF